MTGSLTYSHVFRAIAGLVVAGLALAPLLAEASVLTVLTQFFSLLVLAMMWNLLAGYADIVSVGQHGFVGVGAYAMFGLTSVAAINPYLALPLAGLVTLIIAIPAMAIIFRLRTVYLAIGTWVVAEVMMLVAGKIPGLGLGSGASLPVAVARGLGTNPADRFAAIYYLAFGLAVIAFVSMVFLLRSRIGLGLTAMRDNEEAAGAMGVNLLRTRILSFLWTAPFLGLAGAIITLQKLRVSPAASFSMNDWTVFVIFIVVIGGIGSLEGPIIGTVLFFLLREYLAQLGTWYMMLLGALSIAVILFEPRGLWGIVQRHTKFSIVPVSHHVSTGFAARHAAKP